MNNNILIDAVRLDAEYRELLKTFKKVTTHANPQPILLTGLCEGATDAVYASLIEDIYDPAAKKVPVLLVCPEEKECVRLKIFLSQYGIRVGFFTRRDLTLYNITASHEYEHERQSQEALGSITMNKARGGDGIPVELFQILKDDAVKVLHSIGQQIWKTQ